MRPQYTFFILFLTITLMSGAFECQANILSKSDFKILQQSFQQSQQGSWKKSLQTSETMDDPLGHDILTWLYCKTPGTQASSDDITDFLEDHPEWPGQEALRQQAIRAASARKGSSSLSSILTQKEKMSVTEKWEVMNFYLRKDKKSEAFSWAKDLWLNHALSETQEDTILAAFPEEFDEDDHLARAHSLLWQKDIKGARRLLSFLPPEDQKLIEARAALMRNDSNAKSLYNALPSSLKDEESLLFDLARWYRLKDQYTAAYTIFQEMDGSDVRYPEKWWQERHALLREFIEQKDFEKAYKTAVNHGLTKGEEFANAEFISGWIALSFLQNPPMALPHFETLYTDVSSAISKSRAAYWAGLSEEKDENQGSAEDWFEKAAEYPTTYYGQLSLEKLHEDFKFESPSVSRSKIEDLKDNDLVKVILILHQMGKEEYILPFAIKAFHSLDNDEDVNALLSILHDEVKRYDLTVHVARLARQKGFMTIDKAYPMPNLDIPDHANKALVLALIRQESNFDQEAVSSAGARGLMQLMPATAKRMSKVHKAKYTKARLTEDPTYNILLGSSYIHKRLKEYNGNYVLAIAAYNAGAHNVNEWVKRFGDPRNPAVNTLDWIEQIPFKETRNYVQRVLENMYVYEQIL